MSHQGKVGWLELFYDLVIAASVLVIFMSLKADFTPENQWWLSFVVLVIFSVWLMTTFALNRLPDQSTWVRFLVFVQMGALMLTVFTAASSGAIDDNIGLAFLAVVFLTIGALARTVSSRVGMSALPHRHAGWGAFAVALILGVNALTPQSFNMFALLFVFIAIVVGYFMILLPRMDHRMPIDREHLSERLAQLLLIVMGESFLEIAISYQLGGRPNIVGVSAVVVLLGITWAQYFDVLWGRGAPTTPRLLLVYLAGHAIAILGVGTASVSLANVAISKDDDIFTTLYGTGLTYALMLTYLGFMVIAMSLRPVHPRVITILGGITVVLAILGGTSGQIQVLSDTQMAMVVAGVLLMGVVLCLRAIRVDERATSDR